MQLYVEGEVPERLRATGQTVLGTVMSVGAVLSHLWAGAALETWGADAPYLISGPLAIVLGLCAWLFLRPQGEEISPWSSHGIEAGAGD